MPDNVDGLHREDASWTTFPPSTVSRGWMSLIRSGSQVRRSSESRTRSPSLPTSIVPSQVRPGDEATWLRQLRPANWLVDFNPLSRVAQRRHAAREHQTRQFVVALDMKVRIEEAGQQRLAGGVEDFRPWGNLRGLASARCADFGASHDHHAVRYRCCPLSINQRDADDGHNAVRGGGGRIDFFQRTGRRVRISRFDLHFDEFGKHLELFQRA